MWFVIGVAFGYFANRIFAWLDRLAEKNTESIFTDVPKGKPITFKEWMKRNGEDV